MVRALVLGSALLLLASACGSGSPPSPPAPIPGGVSAIPASRLVGARLVDIAAKPQIEWTFTESGFRVGCDAGLPPDLTGAFGADAGARAIAGKWQLADASEEIVLTDATAAGNAAAARVVLPIRAAGTVRCDLGERQYNVFEASERR